jgi:cytochrome c oxidase subunit 4
MNGHIVPTRIYVTVWAVLVALTAITTAVAYLDLGPLNTPIAVTIAVGKMLLVALFFMHVRYSGRMVRVAAAAGMGWLVILFALTLSDYLTRGAVANAPGW